MKRNVLIHLHPTFFDFCQSLCTSEKIYGSFKSVICLNGPSMQSVRLCTAYSRWLAERRSVFESLWKCPIKFSVVGPRLVLREYLLVLIRYYRSSRSVNIPLAFRYAARDSLIRSRVSYIYLASPRKIKALFEKAVLLRGLALIDIYKKILIEKKVELVISSHAVYIAYVSLIQAAQDLGIDCIVHDTYMTTSIRGISHIYDASYYMKDAYSSPAFYSRRSKSAGLDFISDNSVAKSRTEMSFHTNQTDRKGQIQDRRRMLVILPHIFKDANHTTDPGRWLYENYFSWLVETIRILVFNCSSYDLIVYKVHPDARKFQDEGFMSILGKLLYLGINRSRVRFVGSMQSISDVIPAHDEYILTPLTFQGSATFENGAAGFGTIAVGNPPCPESALYHPESKVLYKQSITDPNVTIGLDSLGSDSVRDCQEQLAIYGRCRLPRDLYSRFSKLLQAGFYFGESRQPQTNESWLKIIDEFRRSYDIGTAKLSDSYSVVEYIHHEDRCSQGEKI